MAKGLDGDKNVYLETVNRMEPDISMIDPGAFYASAAISLKRMADAAEFQSDETERVANACEHIVEIMEEMLKIAKDAVDR